MLISEDRVELDAELREFAMGIGCTHISTNFVDKVDICKKYTIGSLKPTIHTGLETLELMINITTAGPNYFYDQKIGQIIDAYGFIVGSCSTHVDNFGVTLEIHAFQTKEPDDILL